MLEKYDVCEVFSFQQCNHQTLCELIFSNNPLIRLSEPECKDEVTAEYCGDVVIL